MRKNCFGVILRTLSISDLLSYIFSLNFTDSPSTAVPEIVISEKDGDDDRDDPQRPFYCSLVMHRRSNGKYNISSSKPFHMAYFEHRNKDGVRTVEIRCQSPSLDLELEDGDSFIFMSTRLGWTGIQNGGG